MILYLEMAPGELDINVHPTKMEVRFRNPREIYALIAEAVSGAVGTALTPDRKDALSGFGTVGREAYAPVLTRP